MQVIVFASQKGGVGKTTLTANLGVAAEIAGDGPAVRPSPHDLRAVGRTVELAREAGKPFAFVVTQAKSNALLTVQAMAALSEHGVVSPAVVHDRVDFAASMTDGRTVLETDNRGRSASEMTALWEFVKGRMNESTKARMAKVA